MNTALILAHHNDYIGQANYWRPLVVYWQEVVARWERMLLAAILLYPEDRYLRERNFILRQMSEARGWESLARDMVRDNEYWALVRRT